MVCSHCGSPNPNQMRFCGECGGNLTEQSSEPLYTAVATDVLNTPTSRKRPIANQSTVDTLIGWKLEGKYELEARLGSGGMGTVYRAKRLLIGDNVAIKILHPDQVADPQAAERFRREAQAAARLKHPNAVSIYDFGVDDEGLVYLVMELIEGESLRQMIKRLGPLQVSAASTIMTQVCAALDEAHRQHIVHRDLKPDNIIVSQVGDEMRVKVLDFGIAKLRDLTVSNLTQTGSVMGTPHYMSPEQCLGEEVDNRSDVYSLGIVLYEMLTGVVPFNSPTSTAVVVQHVNQAPPSLRAINISISSGIEAIVMRALEKKREARQQTAGTLAQELSSAITGYSGPRSVVERVRTSGQSGAVTGTGDGMAPTMMISTPTWGSTPVSGSKTPIVTSPFQPEAVAAVKPRNKLILPLIGLGVLVLAVVIATFLIKRNSSVKTVSEQKPTPIVAPEGMVYVPGGEFMMGSDSGFDNERPQHKMTVKPFFIDIYEVTNKDYDKFCTETGTAAPASWENGHYAVGTGRRPITGITWDEAIAYAKWAGKRLPTEAEWEFAAKGTDGRRYPWGNDWQPGYANAGPTSIGHMAYVGEHSTGISPFGAFDMVGNAWEWTSSDLIAYPGGSINKSGPTDLKVIRGGCYKSTPEQATTTMRAGWPARGASTYEDTGFRCVKNVDSNGTPPKK